jgi:multiple sugar transport system ATP-binding protein
MVFQSYALYPHMTVFDNLSFGPKVRGVPLQQIEKEVRQAAKLLGIDPLLDRMPKQLSGGERQRVALGRAIIRQPRAFLFDEPLSNLDAKLRLMMRGELLRLHQQFEITTIYVTHDQIEAMTMGDRVVVMKDGSIQQIGTPVEIYRKPANKFVAGFVGSPSINFVNARLESENSSLWLIANDFRVEIPQPHKTKYEKIVGKTVIFGIRPDDLYIDRMDSKTLLTSGAKVEVVEFVGSTVILEVALSSQKLVLVVDSDSSVKVGQEIDIFFDMHKMCLFDAESEQLVD